MIWFTIALISRTADFFWDFQQEQERVDDNEKWGVNLHPILAP
jgi:hypothetical protein